jgi:hypothetical protein
MKLRWERPLKSGDNNFNRRLSATAGRLRIKMEFDLKGSRLTKSR